MRGATAAAFGVACTAAFVALAFACGVELTVRDDPDATTEGGPSPEGAAESGVPDGSDLPPCDVTKPFGAPVALLQSSNLGAAPHLTDDELTLVYTLPSELAVYITTRASRSAPFAPPKKVTTIDGNPDGSPGAENDAMLSADGLELHYTVSSSSTTFDLYRASRASNNADFGSPVFLGGVNTSFNEFHPFLAKNGVLWFARDGQPGRAIFTAALAQDGGFEAPVRVVELDSPSTSASIHQSPTPSADGLTLYFASNREDSNVKIWMATRATPTGQFQVPSKVTELAGSTSAAPGWLSVDKCRLYFDSTASLGPELFVAAKPPR